jgi:hypothetical protein
MLATLKPSAGPSNRPKVTGNRGAEGGQDGEQRYGQHDQANASAAGSAIDEVGEIFGEGLLVPR